MTNMVAMTTAGTVGDMPSDPRVSEQQAPPDNIWIQNSDGTVYDYDTISSVGFCKSSNWNPFPDNGGLQNIGCANGVFSGFSTGTKPQPIGTRVVSPPGYQLSQGWVIMDFLSENVPTVDEDCDVGKLSSCVRHTECLIDYCYATKAMFDPSQNSCSGQGRAVPCSSCPAFS